MFFEMLVDINILRSTYWFIFKKNNKLYRKRYSAER